MRYVCSFIFLQTLVSCMGQSFVDVQFVAGSKTGAKALQVNLSVSPVYPNNNKWNDYVVNASLADGFYAQADTACNGASPGLNACIHSGDKLKVDVSSESSCDGLSIRDELGAFNWICVDNGSSITFYSTGFKTLKGMRDIFNSDSFKENNVTVSNASAGPLR